MINNQASQCCIEVVDEIDINTQEFDLLQLHQCLPKRYPFLLESVAKGQSGQSNQLGRFDILFAFPGETLQLCDIEQAADFVEQLQQKFKQTIESPQSTSETSSEIPFIGGWFAYFSYDYAQVVEPKLNIPQSKFPMASVTRVPAAVLIDHQTAKLMLVAEHDSQHLIPLLKADIKALISQKGRQSTSNHPVEVSESIEEPAEKYLNGVEAIKEYILAGDVFQVNLSRQWQVKLDKHNDYQQVYQALRQANPAPFAALACLEYADGQPWQIISSSPERLVKYQHPWVETRPIAGTRKRGTDLAADKALIEELIQHPKERAEHIMLIDLERNDLGRICQPGTVEVNELMVVETYEHVHHIVSNVRGKLQQGFSPLDIIHALFPGGTITGCPKIRCMEIIAELEKMPREAYTGSLGYINIDGSLDLNILIRTMVQFIEDNQPVVQFRAGAGIVADSEADFELVEAHHKAKGLINALQRPG